MVSVQVKLPMLETLKVESLSKGNTFMLPNKNNSYIPQAMVYMVIGSYYDPKIDCVCLNTGVVQKFNKGTQVIRLSATIECKYLSPDYDDGLPF